VGKHWLARIAAMSLVVAVAGCARAPSPGVNDPYESTNRAWFDRNLALTTMVTGSGEETDEDEAPRSHPFRRAVANFGGNLGLPSSILNDLLQIRPDRATENLLRLVINSTIGIGGIFDPAGHMGLHGRRSDFGETLHRWGVGEGAYMVLPLAGPTTERDAAGMVVDAAINPLRFLLPPPEASWSSVARLAGRVAGAAEYSDILDANVINTADPYAQARLLYLQTRRYHLGIEAEDEIIDPYADF
jgi:Surface lipoprotein